MGYQWFSLCSYVEDEVRCVFKLEPQCGCAWDFDVFVAPAARAQPVFLRLWDTCNGLLREAGIAQTLSRISAYDGASLRAHERMGARRIATAAFLRWGWVQVSSSACDHGCTFPVACARAGAGGGSTRSGSD